MFPEEFVADHVERYTKPGDVILDPFSGRGTTVLQSLLMGRSATGIDINPVAYCVSGAKARTPSLRAVLDRIDQLEEDYNAQDPEIWTEKRSLLPEFFNRAFYYTTLQALLFLRQELDWLNNDAHRFIAALVLGILHGEMGRSRRYLSNQMPRTISPKPRYCLGYWQKHNLWPEEKDTFANLRSEAALRLSGGRPSLKGTVVLSDVRQASEKLAGQNGTVQAVITSPPYLDVTNFEEDQWLRLWFLGNEARPTTGRISRDDRHTSRNHYWQFLSDAWRGIAPLLCNSAIFACRIGSQIMDTDELTDGLANSLHSTFPRVVLLEGPTVTRIVKRQTNAFRPNSVGCRFEVDYVFQILTVV